MARLRSIVLRVHALGLSAALYVLATAGLGCEDAAPKGDYVARVGQALLTREDLDAAMHALPARQDTAEARSRLIEQWVTSELLYQEALRQDLLNDQDVRRRLRDSERAVLIDALVSRLYQEQSAVTPVEMRAYYERHKEQLRLREPFVRVRYLYTLSADSARAVHDRIQQTAFKDAADSLWVGLVRRYAGDVDGSLALASTYYPESRLFREQPALRASLERLQPGQTAAPVTTDGQWHVLQLADRVSTGTIPELPWIEDEVRRLLAIDARKQMYERQVQRLRTEAQSRNALDVR